MKNWFVGLLKSWLRKLSGGFLPEDEMFTKKDVNDLFGAFDTSLELYVKDIQDVAGESTTKAKESLGECDTKKANVKKIRDSASTKALAEFQKVMGKINADYDQAIAPLNEQEQAAKDTIESNLKKTFIAKRFE